VHDAGERIHTVWNHHRASIGPLAETLDFSREQYKALAVTSTWKYPHAFIPKNILLTNEIKN
jgi:hypothetical protein